MSIWEERAKQVQIYPQQLCKTVADGIKARQMADSARLVGVDICVLGLPEEQHCAMCDTELLRSRCLSEFGLVIGPELMSSCLSELGVDLNATAEEVVPWDGCHDADDQAEWWQAWNDNHGRELDAREVHRARMSEMEYMENIKCMI